MPTQHKNGSSSSTPENFVNLAPGKAVFSALVGGVGLFVATACLLVRSGEDVGKHLSLLSNFFPGYSVTWAGCFAGLFYGMLTGGIIGWLIAWIYNRIADVRHPAA